MAISELPSAPSPLPAKKSAANSKEEQGKPRRLRLDGKSKFVRCQDSRSKHFFGDYHVEKPCSGYEMKEITGSGIFAANGEDDSLQPGSANPASNNKTGIWMYQQALAGISHISFAEEEGISPKKPTTLLEVAKQRELSGTLASESDMKLKKQISDAKCKELSGHDIFAPPEILLRPLAARALDPNQDMGEPAPRHVRTSVKKFSNLSGNNVFKGDAPPMSLEKSLNSANLREINRNNIFADGKVES
ncbi:hypothetical protein ACJRO7_024326 [Eucalyptus globulus]|uniref:DUF4057 domain-containing protein n=1 Tax=Eucalyptus globulus TaxID=34317 RepID=A0ABD3K525_EUCGL